ncbi:MAG: formate--tetrahydrofolate ligase, partial [Clostridia bacterium]|nr:formate--tetrahydrofolate ligase [Clostridia bacterium]
MKSDIEIAQSNEMKPILEIADKLGIDGGDIELYGQFKAKIDYNMLSRREKDSDGKLILVTAINPTP